SEIDGLLRRVLHHVHEQHTTDLRHRFDDEHARHDRIPWEMSLKERLIDAHVLDAYDPLPVLDLKNAIHEQEWIAVREHLHDLFDAVHSSLPTKAGQNAAYERNSAAVTWLVCRHPAANTA